MTKAQLIDQVLGLDIVRLAPFYFVATDRGLVNLAHVSEIATEGDRIVFRYQPAHHHAHALPSPAPEPEIPPATPDEPAPVDPALPAPEPTAAPEPAPSPATS